MTAILILLAIILVCIVLWLWAIAPQVAGRPGFGEFKKYDYAHRGLHNKDNGVPENSLKAFSLAALCGFGMELDLQLTKDNAVVVHHDNSILRSCGVDKKISHMTLEELSGYRLFGTQEQIPLFSQVLETVNGRTPMIIELKGYNDPGVLCTLTMELLKDYKGLYCVESFDPRIVQWFKENRPEIVRGQLMERLTKGKDGLTAMQAFMGRHLMTNYLTRPNFEAYDFHAKRSPSLEIAKKVFGMQEVSWTLRTLEDYEKAKAMGNLCIFENIFPSDVQGKEKKSFEEILAAYKTAVCAAEELPKKV